MVVPKNQADFSSLRKITEINKCIWGLQPNRIIVFSRKRTIKPGAGSVDQDFGIPIDKYLKLRNLQELEW